MTQCEAGGLPALLTSKKAPGKRSALTPAILVDLRQRLAPPRGFASYGEIQRYLAQAHHVHLRYSTVHGLVRAKLGAKPTALRRAHPKKTLRRVPAAARPERSFPLS